MTKDKANTPGRGSGNNTPGQTWQGGGGQAREGEKLQGDDPHFKDRTQKTNAPKDKTKPAQD